MFAQLNNWTNSMKQALLFEWLKFFLEITPYSTDLIVFQSFVKIFRFWIFLCDACSLRHCISAKHALSHGTVMKCTHCKLRTPWECILAERLLWTVTPFSSCTYLECACSVMLENRCFSVNLLGRPQHCHISVLLANRVDVERQKGVSCDARLRKNEELEGRVEVCVVIRGDQATDL